MNSLPDVDRTDPGVPGAPVWAEAFPPYSEAEALAEARRCLYCSDAPCMQACPTHIDVPGFIRKIGTDNVRGSAMTILDSNFLGGTCARVCPVEELCQGACVLNAYEKPIAIGRLQRHAVDHFHSLGEQPYVPAPATGHRVLVVGSGPAGLSAAAELAKRGHAVRIWERRSLAGGLSTYGIISLREPVAVALGEVEMVRDLGVEIHTERALRHEGELSEASEEYDAVLVAVGLGSVPALGIPGDEHIVDGLDYIAEAKLSPERAAKAEHVVVVGAGNTAIDAATVARRRGAETTIVYRRTVQEMTAYDHEHVFALGEGIEFSFLTQPVDVVTKDGAVTGLRCIRMELGEPDATGRRSPSPIAGTEFVLPCDLVVAAIGQERPGPSGGWGLDLTNGYVAVDDQLRTSMPKVWAAGDAIRVRGAASTVMAVQDGKKAARAIEDALTSPTSTPAGVHHG